MGSVKKIPQRTCVGCGRVRDKRDMIRILRTPENEIVLDATGKKNGRGAYLCYSTECLEKAVKNKGLERSFKIPVSREVYEKLRKELKTVENVQNGVPSGSGDEGGETGKR